MWGRGEHGGRRGWGQRSPTGRSRSLGRTLATHPACAGLRGAVRAPQLSPPPLPVAFEFLRDELYRFKMFGVLAIMCLVMHALVVGIGNVVAPAPRQAAKQGSQGRPKQQ